MKIITMTKQEVIDVLKLHNAWRRGDEIDMLDPFDIGEAIEYAIKYLEEKK